MALLCHQKLPYSQSGLDKLSLLCNVTERKGSKFLAVQGFQWHTWCLFSSPGHTDVYLRYSQDIFSYLIHITLSNGIFEEK